MAKRSRVRIIKTTTCKYLKTRSPTIYASLKKANKVSLRSKVLSKRREEYACITVYKKSRYNKRKQNKKYKKTYLKL
jgi:hypothetical protein